MPETHTLDDEKQFLQRDFRSHQDVILAHIKWAKNRQFGDSKLLIPIVTNNKSQLCPDYWFLKMVQQIPAPSDAAAFSYPCDGVLVPLTYRELLAQMRCWLSMVGEQAFDFGLQSLRRGGCTTAFEAGLPSLAIKALGDWALDAYLRYIDLTLETRLKALLLFSLQGNKKATRFGLVE